MDEAEKHPLSSSAEKLWEKIALGRVCEEMLLLLILGVEERIGFQALIYFRVTLSPSEWDPFSVLFYVVFRTDRVYCHSRGMEKVIRIHFFLCNVNQIASLFTVADFHSIDH